MAHIQDTAEFYSAAGVLGYMIDLIRHIASDTEDDDIYDTLVLFRFRLEDKLSDLNKLSIALFLEKARRAIIDDSYDGDLPSAFSFRD